MWLCSIWTVLGSSITLQCLLKTGYLLNRTSPRSSPYVHVILVKNTMPTTSNRVPFVLYPIPCSTASLEVYCKFSTNRRAVLLFMRLSIDSRLFLFWVRRERQGSLACTIMCGVRISRDHLLNNKLFTIWGTNLFVKNYSVQRFSNSAIHAELFWYMKQIPLMWVLLDITFSKVK